MGVLLARGLSPNDRGVMVLVMTFPLMIFNLINLGLHESTVFFIGRKKNFPGVVFSNVLILVSILSTLIVLALVAWGRGLVATFLKGLPGDALLPLLILIPAVFIQAVTLSILRAVELFASLNWVRLFGTVLLLVAFLIVLIGFQADIYLCIVTYFLVTWVMTILAVIVVARKVPISLKLDLSLSKEMIRYGSKSYLQIIFESINYRLDVFLIAMFLSPEQVAYYGVATSLAELAWYFPNSVGSVLFSRLSNSPLNQIHQMTADACRITLALTGMIVVALAVACWFFVPIIYGPAYRAAIPSLVILLPGILAVAVHKVLNRNFASRDRQQITILSSTIAMVIIITLDILLIPRWGIVGAAFASSVGYFFAGVGLLVFFSLDTGLSIFALTILRRSDLANYWNRLRFILQTKENPIKP